MRTLAFSHRIRLLFMAVVLVLLFFRLNADANGHLVITGQSRAVYCEPIPGSNFEFCVSSGVPSLIDVYSDRGVLVAETTSTNGYVAIEGIKPGTYNLVATCLANTMLIPSTNGPVYGTFTTATQTVTVRNKNSSEVDLVFYFVPNP